MSDIDSTILQGNGQTLSEPQNEPQFTNTDDHYEYLKARFQPIDDKWHTLATCVYSSIYWQSRRDRYTVVSIMTERLAPGAVITDDLATAMHWFRDPENEALCIVRNGVVMVTRKGGAR